MTHHSCAVERIGARVPGAALTCGRIVYAASRSRKSVRRSHPGASRRSTTARGARWNILFNVDSQGSQHFNFPQRVRFYPSVPMAVTPAMSIELETLAINKLTPLTWQRDLRAAMGVTSKRVGRLESRFCAECLLTDQWQTWVGERSTPGQLARSPHLSTRVVSAESLGLLRIQISSLKREAMMPPNRRRSVNFQGAADNEGGHKQARRHPRRSLPVTSAAKIRGSLPSGAADIVHMLLPIDRARARRDPRSLSSHAAPFRKRDWPHAA